jgi:hypothetical protein
MTIPEVLPSWLLGIYLWGYDVTESSAVSPSWAGIDPKADLNGIIPKKWLYTILG